MLLVAFRKITEEEEEIAVGLSQSHHKRIGCSENLTGGKA
jgi:hypothetical protein